MNWESLKSIVEEKKLETKSKKGCTPLMLAVKNMKMNFIKYLIQNNADLKATDSYGNTSLHWAAIGLHGLAQHLLF